MPARTNYTEVESAAFPALLEFGKYVWKSGIEHSPIDLINLRASQN